MTTLPCPYCLQLPSAYYGHNGSVMVFCKPCSFPPGTGSLAGGGSSIAKATAAWNTVVHDEHGDCAECGALADEQCRVPEDCQNGRTP